jgi:putative glutamine amidotransferase
VAVLVGREPENRYSVHRGYVDALGELGALPLLVPVGGTDPLLVVEWVLGCDAVVLTGGGDVDPAAYHGGPAPGLSEVDPARDGTEFEVLRASMAAGKRVLGICRGVQVMAAATGGALVGDLVTAGHQGHWEEVREHEPVHDIKAEPGSLAERVLVGRGAVNSIHHQAVADPGLVFTASAWSPDGVIEAIEAHNALASSPSVG